MDGIIDAISTFASQQPAIFALIIGIIGAALIAAVVNVGAMLVIWGERKVLGDFAARYGPNRVGGRWGILQLGADAIKLFTKEDSIPNGADRGVFVWAPIVASMATMLVAAAVPFGALHIEGKDYPLVVANMDISAFYVEAALSIMAIGAFMAGYSSNNKYSLSGRLQRRGQDDLLRGPHGRLCDCRGGHGSQLKPGGDRSEPDSLVCLCPADRVRYLRCSPGHRSGKNSLRPVRG